MICSNVDESSVASQIINAVRKGTRNFGIWKIVAIDRLWRLDDPPLAPSIDVVPNQFLLLRVHGNHWTTRVQRAAHLRVDVFKLGISVWMVLTFFGLAVCL